ncbi:MAG TPA: GNAT family N-acetyltransferase [Streptosporangiaceae bacterium]|nr:GNAT family N-acetyltransferase [Streptosporangiaceae bacterium]
MARSRQPMLVTGNTARCGLAIMAGVLLTFRFAEPADVPAIVSLVESAYRGEASRMGWTTEADLLDGQRTDAATVSSILSSEGSAMLVAEAAGRLAGCCKLERQPPATVFFGLFSVPPDRQGQGWGSAILAEAERLAREDWGAQTMVMTVLAQRPDLIAWYERRGYRRTGEQRPFPYDDTRFGVPKRPDLSFVVLAKSLAA